MLIYSSQLPLENACQARSVSVKWLRFQAAYGQHSLEPEETET